MYFFTNQVRFLANDEYPQHSLVMSVSIFFQSSIPIQLAFCTQLKHSRLVN